MAEVYNNLKINFTGRPTKPDVDALIEAFPTDDMRPGTTITHGQIESIIVEKNETSHYKSIVRSWRKRLSREFNIELAAVMWRVILDPHQRISFVSSRHNSAMRQLRKAGDVAARTDRDELTPSELKACDHFVATSALLLSVDQKQARKLKFELKAISDKTHETNRGEVC